MSTWESEQQSLRSIAVYDGTDYPLGIYPMVVTPDGTGLWLGSNRDPDRTSLVRFDLATGEETDVDGHPTLSIDPMGAIVPVLPQPLIT